MIPTAWLGLLTPVVLEIILGIDNLLFIAILAEKTSPEQRDRARYYGLALALLMRFGLASLSHMVSFTQPLFTIWSLPLSGRDLILLTGGFFLFKKQPGNYTGGSKVHCTAMIEDGLSRLLGGRRQRLWC